MFIVELHYLKPLELIDAQLAAHLEFLDGHYKSGLFLASGPKNPRDGGMIIASGKVDIAQLQAILAEDPFAKHGLASYRVVEFSAARFHPALEGLL